ncbi:MAG: zinc finger-like domain-containing protein [Thermoproteota archaeon]|nr:zinc finger-like domain-containing protein [Thermoproteota archaeon]
MEDIILNKIGTQCSDCKGTGKLSGQVCSSCSGNGIGRFYYNYIKFIGPNSTKKTNSLGLKSFARYIGVDNLQGLQTFYNGDIEVLENRIIDYSIYLWKNRKMGLACRSGHLTIILDLYEMNRILLPRKIIKKSLSGQSGVRNRKRGYYLPEIKKMYDDSDLRGRAFIAFMVSGGAREGGVYENVSNDDCSHDFLKFGDLKPCTSNDDADNSAFSKSQLDYLKEAAPNFQPTYKVIVYRGTEDEYVCYITPEASSLIDKYRKQREDAGEKITDDSPLFRNDFLKVIKPAGTRIEAQLENIRNPRPFSCGNAEWYIMERRKRLGIGEWIKLPNGCIRTNIPLIHGFRKFTGVTMGMAKVHDDVNELLLGHTLPGMRQPYRTYPEEFRLAEYFKAVPFLTINQEKSLTSENQNLQTKVENLEKERDVEMAAMRAEIGRLTGIVNKITPGSDRDNALKEMVDVGLLEKKKD